MKYINLANDMVRICNQYSGTRTVFLKSSNRWISANTVDLLQNIAVKRNKNESDDLKVYISKHALKRIRERFPKEGRRRIANFIKDKLLEQIGTEGDDDLLNYKQKTIQFDNFLNSGNSFIVVATKSWVEGKNTIIVMTAYQVSERIKLGKKQN